VTDRPALSARLTMWLDLAARSWPYLSKVDHPARTLLTEILHGQRSVELADGFQVDLSPATALRVNSLLRLSYHGASFADRPNADRQEWGYSSADGILTTPTGIRLHLDGCEPLILAETFLYDVHHAGANLTGRTILDAGAYVGDTALYYASKGAHVYAFEPNPRHYAAFLANLALNPELAPRIHAYPDAVGPDGAFSFARTLSAEGTLRPSRAEDVPVLSRSLASILALVGFKSFWLGKFDIKGSEFAVAGETALGKLERLQVEYTASPAGGSLPELLGRLRSQGFEIERVFKHNYLGFRLREHGTIQARNRALQTNAI
jgi:FkbM family methyltransferase